jgi:4-diphosphocytidyl-2-C-methyl-D-erythritol kinase
MIVYPNAKINIGLNILRKRPDNYHDIETIFYPITLRDELEIKEAEELSFAVSGLDVETPSENNLIVKAYRTLQRDFNLPSLSMHLNKIIPMGAGLGGGSSDAAFTLVALDRMFGLHLTEEKLMGYASELGSDCPFFIRNKPSFASGRGEMLRPVEFCLKGYYIILVKPAVFVSTALAYSGVTPCVPSQSLQHLVQLSVQDWKGLVVNDFEQTVFDAFPEIGQVKQLLYDYGAVYASMSGSGSSVYGLFNEKPTALNGKFGASFVWTGECNV